MQGPEAKGYRTHGVVSIQRPRATLSTNVVSVGFMFFNAASASFPHIGVDMASLEEIETQAAKIASVLRPLGKGVLSREQAKRAAQLLDVHWATVYRLRRRFLANPVTSTLQPSPCGRIPGGRLDAAVEAIIDDVVHEWLPAQRQLVQHPVNCFNK